MGHNIRLERLRRSLLKAGADSLHVSAGANIRYLTAFSGSSADLLVTPDETLLYTDERYRTQAGEQTEGVEIVVSATCSLPALLADLRRRKTGRLAFEANRLSYGAWRRLREARGRRSLVALENVVERLRLIKEPDELAAIRRSAEINSRAFEEACRRARPAWSERRLAAEIEYRMARAGADGPAFETIVASGPHGALPHAEARRERLVPHTLIVVDQGAILDGYVSDMTRMAALGGVEARLKRLFDAVLEAQAAAMDVVKEGVEARTVDAAARRTLRRFGLAERFTHSTGHGLGLEVHEAPVIGPKRRTRLREGMVITIEPGVYVEGLGGVRIEDVVRVTRTGCESLTPTPRELRIL